MRISTILSAQDNVFPTSGSELTAFVNNLSENLEKASGGQIRRKPNWILSQVAKSLPNQDDNFNVNSLKALFTKMDSIKLTDSVDQAQQLIDMLNRELESISSDFLDKYEGFVTVRHEIHDEDENDGYYAYLRLNERGEVSSCSHCNSIDPDETCDKCSIREIASAYKDNEVFSFVLSELAFRKVLEIPTLAEIESRQETKETIEYLVVLQDPESPFWVKTLKVAMTNPKSDVEDKIRRKVNDAMIEDGYHDPEKFDMISCEKISQVYAI